MYFITRKQATLNIDSSGQVEVRLLGLRVLAPREHLGKPASQWLEKDLHDLLQRTRVTVEVSASGVTLTFVPCG